MKPKKKLNQAHEAFGRQQTMAEWAQEAHCSRRALRCRVQRGLTLEQAVKLRNQTTRQALSIEGDVERMAIVELAESEGVSRQAVHLRMVTAMPKSAAYYVLWSCMDWSKQFGIDLSDEELVDIVVLATSDSDVRAKLLDGELEVGQLCWAAKRMTRYLKTNQARYDNE